MDRRTFFSASAALGLADLAHVEQARPQDASVRFPEPPPLSFREERSGLKITAIRAVNLEPMRPLPKYQPAAGSWNTTDVEIANPLSIYPRFKPLLGEDPFQVERLWDIMWRGTLYYGRKGVVVHAISAVDNALWDIVGKALKTPVYKLLGGGAKERVPCYCTGNNIEQAVEFGF